MDSDGRKTIMILAVIAMIIIGLYGFYRGHKPQDVRPDKKSLHLNIEKFYYIERNSG